MDWKKICFIIILVLIVIGVFVMYTNKNKTSGGKKENVEVQDIVEEDISEEKISEYVEDNHEYTKITNNLDEDDLFYITKVVKNVDDTYTLKGVLYTKLIMTKNELEEIYEKGNYSYYNMIFSNEPENQSKYIEYLVKKNYRGDEFNKYEYAFLKMCGDEDKVCYYAVKKDEDSYYIKNIGQFGDEWKLTNNYMEITVPDNLLVNTDAEEITVDEFFKDFKDSEAEETNNPISGFRFEFEDGKLKNINLIMTGC